MKNLPLLFLGIFAAIAASWTGIVLTNQIGFGKLQPFYSPTEAAFFPQPMPGSAVAGKEVYREMGCLYCHSQQVRHDLVFGKGENNPDIVRGWGTRPSIPRDYILERRVYLGTMRTGPDLRNVGARPLTAEWHHQHLFDPQITSPGSTMPPYAFLYEIRKITGQPSPRALTLPSAWAARIPAGYEVVPTARAENLVAYLLSLKDTYGDYPEIATPGAR